MMTSAWSSGGEADASCTICLAGRALINRYIHGLVSPNKARSLAWQCLPGNKGYKGSGESNDTGSLIYYANYTF